MTTLYTGYFAMTKKYEELGLTPVSIAGITPSFFTGDKWIVFAPKKTMFKRWKAGEFDNEGYRKRYLKQLESIPMEKLELFVKYISERSYIMCCYEKTGDFCHRHILGEFLMNKFGITVKEYPLRKMK